VGPYSEKIKAMQCWPTPSSLKHLRGFLGLTRFFRKFIRHYAYIVAPLMDLLKKNAFSWSTEAQRAFDELKFVMSQAPVLVPPNFQEDFVLETSASGQGMGAVLLQKGHPICYFRKKFCSKLQTTSTYVKKLHVITEVVKKWRTYLLGRKFTIHTDQRSLQELMTQVVQIPEQQYYLSKLMGFSYEIVYKPGAANCVADALSRVQEACPQFLGLTIPLCDLVTKIQAEYSSDPTLRELYQVVLQCREQCPEFKIIQGN